MVVKNFLSQEFHLQMIPYSLYLAHRGGLFISGPLEGGGLIHFRTFGGGLIGEGRIYSSKKPVMEVLFELQ